MSRGTLFVLTLHSLEIIWREKQKLPKVISQISHVFVLAKLHCVFLLKGPLKIIFKYFRVIFSLKKKSIQFLLSFNFYFQQKRAPKLSICHLSTKRSVWVFDVTNMTNGFSYFESYHEVVMYLFDSLANERYFENILKSLTEIIFLS